MWCGGHYEGFLLARNLTSNDPFRSSVSWDSDHLRPAIRALGDLVEHCRKMERGCCHCRHHKYPSILL